MCFPKMGKPNKGISRMRVLIVIAMMAVPPVSWGQEQPRAAAPPSAVETGETQARTGTVTAVRGVAILRTAVNSKGTHEGAEVRAVLRQPITLADGTVLAKGTMLTGRVAQVSAHAKTKPNGAVLLLLDRALPKGGPPMPLVVQIRGLAPSVESETSRVQLPGARLGGTSNAGGTEQMDFQANDRSSLHSNAPSATGLEGVYLRNSAGGSGVVFSPGADVYLDDGTQMTLVMARDASKVE